MNLPVQQTPVYLNDETISEIYRLRSLLEGATALLRRPGNKEGAALRELIAESHGVADVVVTQIESIQALLHERRRTVEQMAGKEVI